MASTQETENASAVDRAAQLDADGRRHVAEIRARNALIVAITNESWGERMSPTMRRAFAEYMRRFRLDVSEVDNLGGRPYRNGYYYRRRIAEMRARGLIDWTSGDHIGPDARLDALVTDGDTWAQEEQTRRVRERIRWAVPDDATHAYVTRVKLKGDQNPLEGCDWITPGRVKQTRNGPKVADPIGEDEPEKTVITRSWRRVGLLAAAEIPELRQDEEAMDAAAVEVSTQVEEIRTAEANVEQLARIEPRALPAINPSDPYAADVSEAAQSAPKGAPVEATPVTKAGTEVAVRAAHAATTRDPMADPPGDGAETALDERLLAAYDA